MSLNEYKLLDRGFTANVYLLPQSNKVCKSFLADGKDVRFPIEKEAYERFTARGHPASILRYYGVDVEKEAGIILELAEKGTVWNYLWDHAQRGRSPSSENLLKWAYQAAEALDFAHSCGVLHSDVHCANFLFDENLDLKVADFAEASIDGGESLLFYRTTHSLPRARRASTASEIFALGSSLYFMVTGYDLFPELKYPQDKQEITRRLTEKEFPNTTDFAVLGSIIRKCWNVEYKNLGDVLDAIKSEMHHLRSLQCR